MIRWIRRHLYTLLGAFSVAGLIAWVVLTWGPYSWLKVLAAALYGAANASRGVPALLRRRDRRNGPPPWRPSGPSLPCPPQCHIRVAHRHDPIGSFR